MMMKKSFHTTMENNNCFIFKSGTSTSFHHLVVASSTNAKHASDKNILLIFVKNTSKKK